MTIWSMCKTLSKVSKWPSKSVTYKKPCCRRSVRNKSLSLALNVRNAFLHFWRSLTGKQKRTMWAQTPGTAFLRSWRRLCSRQTWRIFLCPPWRLWLTSGKAANTLSRYLRSLSLKVLRSYILADCSRQVTFRSTLTLSWRETSSKLQIRGPKSRS